MNLGFIYNHKNHQFRVIHGCEADKGGDIAIFGISSGFIDFLGGSGFPPNGVSFYSCIDTGAAFGGNRLQDSPHGGGGLGRDDPPNRFRIVWGLGEGFVAAVLLLAGGLKALQTASIAAALPISVIMLLMAWGIVKSLHEDPSAVLAGEATEAPDGTSLSRDLHA